jgi:dihydroorotase-like cyclic amidohydrolase
MLIKTKGRRIGWIVCALIPLLVVVACGKKQGSTASEQATKEQAATEKATAATGGVESSDPLRNYKVAYLTDEKMEKFIESLKEEMNPFDVVFKGGQMRSSSSVKDEVEKFNAFAQKYGFKGYEDYMAVWGRITVGEAEIGAEEMTKGMKESMEKMAADAENLSRIPTSTRK